MAAAQLCGRPAHCPAAFRLLACIVFARIQRVWHGPVQRTMEEWPKTSQGSAMDVQAAAPLDGGDLLLGAVHTLLAAP